MLNVIVCICKSKLLVHPSPYPLPLGNHKSILCVCESVSFSHSFICVIFWIPHIINIIWYLSFSFLLTSLSMIISRTWHPCWNWHPFVLFFTADYYSKMVHIIACKLYLYKHSWRKTSCTSYTVLRFLQIPPNLTNLSTFIHSMCLAKEFPFNFYNLG